MWWSAFQKFIVMLLMFGCFIGFAAFSEYQVERYDREHDDDPEAIGWSISSIDLDDKVKIESDRFQHVITACDQVQDITYMCPVYQPGLTENFYLLDPHDHFGVKYLEPITHFPPEYLDDFETYQTTQEPIVWTVPEGMSDTVEISIDVYLPHRYCCRHQ